MERKVNWANRVTLVRIFLVPVFVILVAYYRPGLEILKVAATIVFLTAILTDAIDGYLAKTKEQRTELGTFLDPAADKLLLISAFICLSLNHRFLIKLPLWVSIIVIGRDVVIVMGLAIVYMVTGSIKVEPDLLGKTTTFFQMMTVSAVLLNFNFSFLIWNITAFLTVASGINYITRENKRLAQRA
ncbi:MAG: CDP-alcohol phosphatidyltransferase family protein [Candidatus Omnitrophota bacterium]|nr:CDP-alcohol phosphatidyltransferase family protein [Candidatus Omnitrophota bacterium]